MENVFWTIIILGAVIYLATRKKTNSTMPISNEKLKDTDKVHPDVLTLEQQVQKRIKEAEKKELPDLAMNMLDECKYFATWINQNPRNWVPPFVLEATEEKVLNKHQEKEFRLKLKTINGVIEFRQGQTSSWDRYVYGEFNFFWEGHNVLSFSLSRDRDQTDDDWRPLTIEGYIPGEWETLIKSLEESINHNTRMNNRKSQENPARLNEVKKKFGL